MAKYIPMRQVLLVALLGLAAVSRLAIASSDTGTLLVGEESSHCVGGGSQGAYGYDSSFLGSYSPTGLTGGKTVDAIEDHVVVGCGIVFSYFQVSGFSSNPGSSWLTSITCNGVTNDGSAAYDFSYGSGIAVWYWSKLFALTSKVGSNVSCTIVHS